MALTELTPPVTPPDEERASAGGSSANDRAVVTGVLWQGTLRWLSQVLSWSATIVIARRLSPADYGTVGAATVLVGLLTLVTDGGIGRALVVRRERDEVLLRQAHGAGILLGGIMALVMLLAAYPLGQFYGEPRMVGMVAALSPVLLFSGMNTTPMAVLQQQLRYRRLAALEFAKAIVQAATVLCGALLGFGAWSLVAGLLAGNATAVLITRRWVPLAPARPTRRMLASTVTYARHLVVASTAWYMYSNADFAVVGRVAGLTALGFYQFAWNVAQLPGEKLGNVLQTVVGPFFGAIGDNIAQLKHYYLLLTELLASVMLPVLCGFGLAIPIAVPLVFGAKWLPAVPIMQILVICSAMSSVSTLGHHVLNATGNAAVGARVNLVALLVMPVAFYLAARLSGPLAVAGVWLIAQPVLIAVPLIRVRRAVGISLGAYAANLRAPFISSLVMTLMVLGIDLTLRDRGSVVRLVAMVISGAITYVGVYTTFFRPRIDAIVAVWRSRV